MGAYEDFRMPDLDGNRMGRHNKQCKFNIIHARFTTKKINIIEDIVW